MSTLPPPQSQTSPFCPHNDNLLDIISEDEKFWEHIDIIDRSGNRQPKVIFRPVQCLTFLQNRGFARLRTPDGNFRFICQNSPFIQKIQWHDIRDYILEYTRHLSDPKIFEMMLKSWKQYLNYDSFTTLQYYSPQFQLPDEHSEFLYFNDHVWKISKNSVETITYDDIDYNIWQENKAEKHSQYIGELISFDREDNYIISDEGKKCNFLKFLVNCSDFTWRKDDLTEEDTKSNNRHLLSKLCAIGYLSMSFKNPSVTRAVISMDGQLCSTGTANGRSGKSLFGMMIKNVIPTLYIDGKKKNIFADPFLWHELEPQHRLVFMDDVRADFDFDNLFTCLTGDWTVNHKHGTRTTLPFERSPKIYISTNHTITGDGGSFSDRQWLLAFSDYYNSDHKPNDDFGTYFFTGWDFEQWNLAYNLIANCIQLYLRYGVVQAPMELINAKKLQSDITEEFITWADSYFIGGKRLGSRIKRIDMYTKFLKDNPIQGKYMTTKEFKIRLKKYCELRNLIFNPKMYDLSTMKPLKTDKYGIAITADKTNGVEYFTLSDK